MARVVDVAVVGGGPAGSTAARACAAAGLDVALIDKAEFPRDKPCGGGVTIRCARLLPFDLTSVSERTVHGVAFSSQPRTRIDRRSEQPVTYLTQRRHLDTFLLEQAEVAGASIFQRSPLKSLELINGSYQIAAGAHRLTARYVIAADGANGVTARYAGIPTPRWKGIALEGNWSSSPFPSAWDDTIGVDFGHIRGGYGWLFPKGDHVNIGLGSWHDAGPTLRARLHDLARWYGFDPDSVWGLRGHPLPIRRPGGSVGRDRVLLVGDAAGFLDPFTGEGIYAAMWSGMAAARQIRRTAAGQSQDLVAGYLEEIEDGLLQDLRVSRKLYDLFHVAPWLWTHGMRSSGVWGLACRLLRGDQTYSGASRSSWASSGLSVVYELLKLKSQEYENSAKTTRGPLFFAS